MNITRKEGPPPFDDKWYRLGVDLFKVGIPLLLGLAIGEGRFYEKAAKQRTTIQNMDNLLTQLSCDVVYMEPWVRVLANDQGFHFHEFQVAREWLADQDLVDWCQGPPWWEDPNEPVPGFEELLLGEGASSLVAP